MVRVNELKKPGIRLQPTSTHSQSKFGGFPSVESEIFQWPSYQGNPLAFLGQIDLAEMASILQFEWMPSSGQLLFFYDIIEQCSGRDPTECESWRVIYQQNPDNVAQFPDDLDIEAKFTERFITGAVEYRLPPYADHVHIHNANYALDKPAFQELMDLKAVESEAETPYYQFGGYPTDPNYGSARMDAHLAFHGLKMFYQDVGALNDLMQGTPLPGSCSALYTSDDALKIETSAEDWELLLQLDTDNEFIFGDGYKLFFYVQKTKAKENNFEDCWIFSERV